MEHSVLGGGSMLFEGESEGTKGVEKRVDGFTKGKGAVDDMVPVER